MTEFRQQTTESGVHKHTLIGNLRDGGNQWPLPVDRPLAPQSGAFGIPALLVPLGLQLIRPGVMLSSVAVVGADREAAT
jgi:hypothetical protein